MIIYHNPRCSTSREALDLLKKAKLKPEIREYLADPPTQKELKALLKKLGCKAIDLVRKKEALYREKYAGQELSNAKWIKVLSENPVLIERPVVITEDRAVIGRPPQKVLELLEK
jgi:arsenate reductase (glutaredoxin)